MITLSALVQVIGDFARYDSVQKQKKMLFGKEKKALPFIIGTMNISAEGVYGRSEDGGPVF
jgi:hypothetical protein